MNNIESLLITFGKEYELGYNLGFSEIGLKYQDGSGPSEIITPVFSLTNEGVVEAVIVEDLLERVYGRSLFDYYYRDDYHSDDENDEEKGCHFHVGGFSNAEEYFSIKKALWILLQTKLKKLFARRGFRNTVDYWAEMPSRPYDDYGNSRDYSAITSNISGHIRKKNPTIELRLAEYSIVGDIAFLAISIALNEILNNIGISELEVYKTSDFDISMNNVLTILKIIDKNVIINNNFIYSNLLDKTIKYWENKNASNIATLICYVKDWMNGGYTDRYAFRWAYIEYIRGKYPKGTKVYKKSKKDISEMLFGE